MFKDNNNQQSLWKLFIISPFLIAFFFLFQIESNAQAREFPVEKMKIETIFDENSTQSELDSIKIFLLERYNIDMNYLDAEFQPNGNLKSIVLEVNSNDGFKGSVTSPDVELLPIYFFRDFSKTTDTPFGLGVKPASEISPEDEFAIIKDTQTFIINGKKIDKADLSESYIPVDSYIFNDNSKTLSITTNSKFDKPYFAEISGAMEEISEIYGTHITEALKFFNVTSDYEVVTITLHEFQITDKTEKASQYENEMDGTNFQVEESVIYLLDGKPLSEEEFSKIHPDQIESVDIIKSASELKALGYNSKTLEAVVKITLKK